MPNCVDLRCSTIVFRQQAGLLVHRTRDGLADWVLRATTGITRTTPSGRTG